MDLSVILTEQERELVNKLKDAIRGSDLNLTEDEWEDWCDDWCFVRYLRARNWNVEKATEMLKATLQWRREIQPDRIPISAIEWQLASGKNYIRGYDRFDRPIIWIRVRRDSPYNMEDKLKLMIFQIESAIRAIPKHGRHNGKICLVVDLQKLSLKNADISIVTRVLHMLQYHYPERLGVLILLQAPLIFNILWTAARPFLDEVTKNKLISVPYKSRKETLCQYISEEELDVEYGGRNSYEYNHTTYWDAIKAAVESPENTRGFTTIGAAAVLAQTATALAGGLLRASSSTVALVAANQAAEASSSSEEFDINTAEQQHLQSTSE